MPEEKEVKVETSTSELKSPRDWALATGNGPVKGRSVWTGSGMSSPRGSVAYEVAKTVHGWPEHEHHAGSPMMLSKEDFLAALKAAMPAVGNPVPHKPALSPHKGGAVKVTFKG